MIFMRILMLLALIALVIISGCVSTQQNNSNQTEEIDASFFLPRFFELGGWSFQEKTTETVEFDGFQSGVKMRMTRREGDGRYVGRLTIYQFNGSSFSEAFQRMTAGSESGREGFERLAHPLSSTCYANNMTAVDLERTNIYCVKNNVYFQVEITGDNTANAGSYMFDIAKTVEDKIDAVG